MITLQANVKDLQSPRPKRSEGGREIGTGNTMSTVLRGDYLNYEPTLDDINWLIRNDGTARALYNLLRMPIIGNSYRFDPDPDDKLEVGTDDNGEPIEEHPQAEFVENNFTLPPHKGGMSIPFRLVITHMLKAHADGYAPFEKVWDFTGDNLVYKKIAPRPVSTIEEVLLDENGGFAGLKQRAWKGKKFETVLIEPGKAFVFTVNKEEHIIKGQPTLRTAWYHGDRKHRLYALYENAIEKGSMPPKVLKVEEGNDDPEEKQEAALAAVDQFGINTAVKIPSGYNLTPYEVAKNRIDPMPGIEHHNSEMATSVLAQFIKLSQGEGSTGSYALSKSQSDIFIMCLRSYMTDIEEHINSYLIPQLVEYNFATPLYPEFKFNDLTDETREFLEAIFTKVVEKIPQGLSLEFLEGLQKQVAERLGLEIEDFSPANLEPVADEPVNNSAGGQKKKNLAEGGWRRPLTNAEEQIVDLAAVEKEFTRLEDQFTVELKPVFERVKEQALKDLQPILAKPDLDKLESFQLRNFNQYRGILTDTLTESYNVGKKQAADELEVKAPKTPAESRDLLRQIANSVTELQYNDLVFIIRSLVTKEVQKGNLSDARNLDADAVLDLIASEFDTFFDEKIFLTGSILVSQGINKARDDVFSTSRDLIAVYQYSAILDARVCPTCEDLDRTVLEERDYRATRWVPPIHMYCRCIWIAIKKDQSEIPDVEAEPEMPGGMEEPQLSAANLIGRKLELAQIVDQYNKLMEGIEAHARR